MHSMRSKCYLWLALLVGLLCWSARAHQRDGEARPPSRWSRSWRDAHHAETLRRPTAPTAQPTTQRPEHQRSQKQHSAGQQATTIPVQTVDQPRASRQTDSTAKVDASNASQARLAQGAPQTSGASAGVWGAVFSHLLCVLLGYCLGRRRGAAEPCEAPQQGVAAAEAAASQPRDPDTETDRSPAGPDQSALSQCCPVTPQAKAVSETGTHNERESDTDTADQAAPTQSFTPNKGPAQPRAQTLHPSPSPHQQDTQPRAEKGLSESQDSLGASTCAEHAVGLRGDSAYQMSAQGGITQTAAFSALSDPLGKSQGLLSCQPSAQQDSGQNEADSVTCTAAEQVLSAAVSDTTNAATIVLRPSHGSETAAQTTDPTAAADSADVRCEATSNAGASVQDGQAVSAPEHALVPAPACAAPVIAAAAPAALHVEVRVSREALDAMVQHMNTMIRPAVDEVRQCARQLLHSVRVLSDQLASLQGGVHRAVQSVDGLRLTGERWLGLRETHAHATLAARSLQLGITLMACLLLYHSVTRGRLRAVAVQCFPQAAAGYQPAGATAAAGSGSWLGAAAGWVPGVGRAWSWLGWARIVPQSVTCTMTHLGYLRLGLFLMQCAMPCAWAAAGRQLADTWQLDLPFLFGALGGVTGAFTVHALGGSWVVWLLLWWAWCGVTALLCSGHLAKHTLARTACVLTCLVAMPVLAGCAPFWPGNIPFHRRVTDSLSGVLRACVVRDSWLGQLIETIDVYA